MCLFANVYAHTVLLTVLSSRKIRAKRYYEQLRKEMRLTAELGYNFSSVYIGGGTPTVLVDELAQTIDLARELFEIKEVSCETNPNHLTEEILGKLQGRVQRLSVGMQSFDDGLLETDEPLR